MESVAIPRPRPHPSSLTLPSSSMQPFSSLLKLPSLGFHSPPANSPSKFSPAASLAPLPFSPLHFRRRSVFTFSSSHGQDSPSEIQVDEEIDVKVKAEESKEAWKQTLESFKEQALKMQSISQEAYELYFEKAMIILNEAAGKLKIQAEKARRDLTLSAKEISEESKEYLSAAAENSPEPVKDVVEIFSSADEIKEVSKVLDFYLGIPYGVLLSAGGFLSFMLTGSISAIRFGVILGGSLLAFSVSSLRSWKKGESNSLALKGQAAIATILFLRELRLFFVRPFIFNFAQTVISGAMVAFYAYRIFMNNGNSNMSAELQS